MAPKIKTYVRRDLSLLNLLSLLFFNIKLVVLIALPSGNSFIWIEIEFVFGRCNVSCTNFNICLYVLNKLIVSKLFGQLPICINSIKASRALSICLTLSQTGAKVMTRKQAKTKLYIHNRGVIENIKCCD